MSRLRIGPRLSLAFATLILFMSLGSAVGLWQLRSFQSEAEHLLVAGRQANAVLRVHNTLLFALDELEKQALARDAEGFILSATLLSDQLTQEIDEAVGVLTANGAASPRHAEVLAELEAIQNTFPAQLGEMNVLARQGEWDAIDARLLDQLLATSNSTRQLAQWIDGQFTAEQAAALDNLTRRRRTVLLTTVGVGIFTVVLGGALAISVTGSITRPLGALSEGARAWIHGAFDHRVQVQGDDELARLGRVFNDGAAQLAELYDNLEGMVEQRTDELRHRALQLETSVAVGRHITSILDLDDLLPQVVELIRERFNYYYVGVFLLDDDGRWLVEQAGSVHSSDQMLRLKVGVEGIIGWVAAQEQSALVNDVYADERYYYWAAVPDTQAELALPLKMGGELLGVLDFQSDQIGAFHAEDMPILQSLADQVAIAIHNASLYQGELLQRQLAETLQQVGRALNSTLELSEVLDLILKLLHALVPYDRGSVLLSHGDELEIVAARGFPERFDPSNTRVQIERTDKNDVFSTIYHTKRPLPITDIDTYPGWRKVSKLQNPKSWLGVPLLKEGEVIGMLSLACLKRTHYHEQDIRAATAFAAQAAIAIENAQLYARIKRFNQQLEYEVQKRTEALQTAYTQLEQLDRTKSSFISVASHELRTPITVLKGYSQILLKDPRLQSNDYYRNLLEGILSGTLRLHTIVESMLDMARIDDRTLELYPAPLSIYDLVRDVLSQLEEDIKERRLSLTVTPAVEKLPFVEADEDSLKKVFYHLVINAIKYTPDGGIITIDGRAWTEAPEQAWPTAGVEIVVSDTGIGIDPEYQDLIFNKFYQTGEVALHSTGRTKFKGGGPGLGLAITQGIITVHRGLLWVESPGYDEETCPGSEFHVVLPTHNQLGGETPSGEAVEADPVAWG